MYSGRAAKAMEGLKANSAVEAKGKEKTQGLQEQNYLQIFEGFRGTAFALNC